ncbi:MAG: putative zinc-binding metallopeptidase, partial [Rubrivivax sp.]
MAAAEPAGPCAGAPVFFGNSRCLHYGQAQGFAPAPKAWATIDAAKRRRVSQPLALGLPLRSRLSEDSQQGLMFDFLQPLPGQPVRTGHADGPITLNIEEADDTRREALLAPTVRVSLRGRRAGQHRGRAAFPALAHRLRRTRRISSRIRHTAPSVMALS